MLVAALALGVSWKLKTPEVVEAEVWDRIPFPYFKYSTDPIIGHKFNEMQMISEDMFWCAQMHKAGIKVWIDPKVQCGHIGVLEATRTLYETGFEMAKAMSRQQ